MKRLFGSLGVLLVLVIVAFSFLTSLRRGCVEMANAYQPYTTLEAVEPAAAEAEALSLRWKDLSEGYACLMQQKELHDIGILTNRLASACRAGDADRVHSLADEILYCLEHLKEDELPTFGNVF